MNTDCHAERRAKHLRPDRAGDPSFDTQGDSLTRRRFLYGLAGGVAVSLLAACGSAPAGSPASSPAAPSSAPASAAPASAKPSAAASASAAAKPAASPSAAQASAAAKRPLDVVKRGNLRGITFAAAIAKARGYFEELGVEDQDTVFASGSEQTQAIAAGQLEMGATSITAAFFNAMARGVRQPWVLDNWHLEKGDQSSMVVLRPDLTSTVTKLTDLKGLKNATSTPIEDGGFGVTAYKMFQPVGMKMEDVDWQVVSFPDMLAALGNKAVDAAWLIEPFITLGKAKNLLVPWQNMGDYDPGAQIAGLVYSDTFIKNRLDVAKRWAVAYVRGIRDFNDYKKS
ncbi:MAG TPA: ABC transporter substrate-binding protein, partial [Chloroflexota bacterium]|nr:ABC transporter substrate-binding protein [Chloroflexota bacterium]